MAVKSFILKSGELGKPRLSQPAYTFRTCAGNTIGGKTERVILRNYWRLNVDWCGSEKHLRSIGEALCFQWFYFQ
jgi:hypothetical protein